MFQPICCSEIYVFGITGKVTIWVVLLQISAARILVVPEIHRSQEGHPYLSYLSLSSPTQYFRLRVGSLES